MQIDLVTMSYNRNHPFPALFNDAYDTDNNRKFNQDHLAHRNTVHNSFESRSIIEDFQPGIMMDIHENPETNMVTATFNLPGMRKESVHVEVYDKETLVVSGEMTVDSEVDEQGFVHRERHSERFARSVRIPPGTTVRSERNAICNHS